MQNKKARAIKSSIGISLPLFKEKFSHKKYLYDIDEAAKELKINEMVFRQFLAQNIFDYSGFPKWEFVEKGYFLLYSKKIDLNDSEINLKNIKIPKKGLSFLGWLLNIKKIKK